MEKNKILDFIWKTLVKHPRDTVEGVMNVVQREAIIDTKTDHRDTVMWARDFLRWIDDDCERYFSACQFVLLKRERRTKLT